MLFLKSIYISYGVDTAGLGDFSDPHILVMSSYDEPWKTHERRDEVLVRRVKNGEGHWSGPWVMS